MRAMLAAPYVRAANNTLTCCDTAGRLIANGSANSPMVHEVV